MNSSLTSASTPHLCHGLFGALIEGVLAHVYQLSEEHVADLREAPAGRLHQGVQDGADVWLDAYLQQLLSLGEDHRCGEWGTRNAREGRRR